MKTVTMSEETIRAAIDYIMRSKCGGEILLNWFGGEPLLRADIIDRFCVELKERGVSFKSRITTNGSLITPELARKIKPAFPVLLHRKRRRWHGQGNKGNA